jgi:hypothetical protein
MYMYYPNPPEIWYLILSTLKNILLNNLHHSFLFTLPALFSHPPPIITQRFPFALFWDPPLNEGGENCEFYVRSTSILLFFCSEYLSAKQEVDQLRQRQSRLRNERDVSMTKYCEFLSLLYVNNLYASLWNSLIIYEENTNEIMSVKEFVYLIQNHADSHKL